MPDISKINALAIGSVAKVDGLAKASILDIDGVAVPAGVAPPLDTYTGAAVAYSVRLLRTTYTGDIMRVRRASDNVEGDVGFDGGELKLTSPISNTSDAQSYTDLADFVDHTGTPTDAFCRYWYDQSGNAKDAGQSTAASQPQIYDATTGLITENGKPALEFRVSNNQFDLTGLTNAASNYSCAIVNKNLSSNSFNFDSQSGRLIIDGRGVSKGAYYDGGWRGTMHTGNAQVLNTFFLVSPSNGETYQNGSAINTGLSYTQTAVGGTVVLGADYGDPTTAVKGPYQEFILWPSDERSNRTGIESNINGFFSIYP